MGRYGVYGLAALCAFGSAAVGLDRYLRSHLGRLAPAVRDNELRVEYMGASVRNVVHLNLVIAAGMAGMGGALTALAVGHIDPEMAYWTTSGEFVFVAILSGTASVAAPFAGALLLELLRSFAYEHAPNTWQLVMGAAMLAVILFLPEGLWSLFLRRRRARDMSADPGDERPHQDLRRGDRRSRHRRLHRGGHRGGAHRRQRRRQDHLPQPGHGLPQADRGHGPLPGTGHHRPGAAPDHPPRASAAPSRSRRSSTP